MRDRWMLVARELDGELDRQVEVGVRVEVLAAALRRARRDGLYEAAAFYEGCGLMDVAVRLRLMAEGG